MCSCQILSQFSSGSDEVSYGGAAPVGTPTELWEEGESFLPSGTGGLHTRPHARNYSVILCGCFVGEIFMHVYI